jgi:ubiquinone/menaquinone biosynthesis C-methylase UbiE
MNIFKNKDYVNQYEYNKYGRDFGKYLKQQEISQFQSMIDEDCKSILDIGSGTGKLSLSVDHDRYWAVSLDSSYEMLKTAKSYTIGTDVKCSAVVCNAESICFSDRTFDCVVASRLLLHLPDWKTGLSEICRVSKKSIIFDFPSTISFSFIDSIFKRLLNLFACRTISYKTFRFAKIIKQLKVNDFTVIESKKNYFLPMLVYRILDRPGLKEKIEHLFQYSGLTNIFGSSVVVKAVRNN